MSSVFVVGGRYRLLNGLGGDGPETAWRGYDQILDRTVTVKLLDGDSIGAAERERVRVEAGTAAQLSHPHICQVLSYGESRTDSGDCVAYLVTEQLSGPTLEERLRAYPMPVRVALRIGAQVASALAAAHSRGLMHRDLTTANIILAATGPKIVDFGVPVTGRTPACLAPERLRGGKVSPASDVYALGMLIYRMVSGTAPWPAGTVTRMLEDHEYQPPAPLPHVDELAESAVAELCHRCLAEDPGERPTAHEVARRLAHEVGLRVLRAGEELVPAEDDTAGPAPAPVPEPLAVQTAPAPPPIEARPYPPEAAPAEPPPAPAGGVYGSVAHPHVRRHHHHHHHHHHHRRWPVLLAVVVVIALVAAVTGGIWLARGGPAQGQSGSVTTPGEQPVGVPATDPARCRVTAFSHVTSREGGRRKPRKRMRRYSLRRTTVPIAVNLSEPTGAPVGGRRPYIQNSVAGKLPCEFQPAYTTGG